MATIYIHVDLRFPERLVRGALVALLLFMGAAELGSETMTMTLSTSLPAPTAAYQKLVTTGNTYLTLNSGGLGVGGNTAGGGVSIGGSGVPELWANGGGDVVLGSPGGLYMDDGVAPRNMSIAPAGGANTQYFRTQNTVRMRIMSDGVITAGNVAPFANPNWRLQVGIAGGTGDVYLRTSAASCRATTNGAGCLGSEYMTLQGGLQRGTLPVAEATAPILCCLK